jgi:hypothetical protein
LTSDGGRVALPLPPSRRWPSAEVA